MNEQQFITIPLRNVDFDFDFDLNFDLDSDLDWHRLV